MIQILRRRSNRRFDQRFYNGEPANKVMTCLPGPFGLSYKSLVARRVPRRRPIVPTDRNSQHLSIVQRETHHAIIKNAKIAISSWLGIGRY